jgi:Domain of unknown function (DUF4382)
LNLGTKAAAYGIAGLVLAGAIMVSGSMTGLLPATSTGPVSIMLTDPPTVPDGVTGVYIGYSDVAVHAQGFDNGSGWVKVSGQGVVDTLDLVNLSQTISSGSIPSLTYNLVSLRITSALVEFKGRNYTTAINIGKIVVQVNGGFRVNSSDTSAALVDIHPTVINLGSVASPSFVLAAGARALQMPANALDEQVMLVGHRVSLVGRPWFQAFEANHHDGLEITHVVLSSSLVTFTAVNNEAEPVTIGLVLLSPASNLERPESALASATASIILLAEPNGTLEMVSTRLGQGLQSLAGSGYTLVPGAEHTFDYYGTIAATLSLGSFSSGANYYIVAFGSDASVNRTAVAP